MKYAIFTIIFLMASSLISAEERDSLFKSKLVNGGFGGPAIHVAEINGDTNYLLGGQGAWLINHKYYLGGAGYSTAKDINDTKEKLSYGGLLVGSKFNPFKTVHYAADILIGAGNLENENTKDNSTDDILFFIQPGLYLNINLTDFAELNFGINYRYINGSNQSNLSDSDLSGVSIGANIMFGKF